MTDRDTAQKTTDEIVMEGRYMGSRTAPEDSSSTHHDEAAQRKLVGAVLKVVDLIEIFPGGPNELSLTELTARTGFPMPTVHRLLATLEHARWVQRGPNGGYCLSLRLVEIAKHVLAGIDLREQAYALMHDLTLKCGETSYLVVREADRAVCVERVDSDNMVRIMSMGVGSSLPMWAGAGPLALLAYQGAEESDRVLTATPMQKPTGGELSVPEVQQRLAVIREHGYSTSTEDWIQGISSIGAPIFGADGKILAAISVGGLTSVMMGLRTEMIIQAVVSAAEAISRRLGYQRAFSQ